MPQALCLRLCVGVFHCTILRHEDLMPFTRISHRGKLVLAEMNGRPQISKEVVYSNPGLTFPCVRRHFFPFLTAPFEAGDSQFFED